MSGPLSPIILWDVDGVLNPPEPTDSHISYIYDGRLGAPLSVTSVVHLNPLHAGWIAELTAAGASHGWATSWGYLARTWIAPKLGCAPAAGWPVVEVGECGGVRFGHTYKFNSFVAFLGRDQPAFWIDDVFGGKDLHWADDRTERGVPTVVRCITSSAGLSRDDIDAALEWLVEIQAY